MPKLTPQHRHDIEESGAQQGHDRQQEEQVGDGLPGIDNALHAQIIAAPEERGGHADERAQQCPQGRRPERDGERDACAIDDATQQIPAQLVRPQPVLETRGPETVQQARLRIAIGGEDVGENRRAEQREDDAGPQEAERLLADQPHPNLQEAGARTGYLVVRCASWPSTALALDDHLRLPSST